MLLIYVIFTAIGVPTHHPLAVWWKGDDDLEFFTLRCRREDQMRQWEATINRLIKEAAQRRALERPNAGMSRIIAANSTNPSPQGRVQAQSHNSTSYGNGPISMYTQSSAVARNSRPSYSTNNSNYDDEQNSYGSGSTYSAGPQGYPPHDGFDMEEADEDELEDYPLASSYSQSGRGTPVGSRRTPNTLSMPPERESSAGYDKPRAMTEGTDGPVMAQWRTTNGLPPVPSAGLSSANSSLRPMTPRMHSNMSANSYASDASFGNGVMKSASTTQRPQLRSQFSSTRLRTGTTAGYESPSNTSSGSDYRKRAATPTLNVNNLQAPTVTRSRSASQPSAYVPQQPKTAPPPMPNGAAVASSQGQSHWSREARPLNGVPTDVLSGKRGSGSSESTGESSDYSPNSSSPITPFGSSESSLGGVGIRNSRSHGNFDGSGHHHHHQHPPLVAVKVKVHFHEDIFVIQVPRATEYDDLVEKVGRKIRLCGPRRDDGPLRVKYRDEDGDMVSLGSTEDVQMAFEQYRPGGQVTLFVT